MDILFAAASGLGLRLISISLPSPSSRIASAIVGLWEGSLISRTPLVTIDHLLAYGIRLVFDLLLSRDPARPIAVALWTGVGIFICQVLDLQTRNEPVRKRSRRRRPSGSASLPPHVRVYAPPPPQPDPKPNAGSSHVSPRTQLRPHERPSTPPSFFLQGEDSYSVLNLSPAPNQPPAQTDVSVPPRPSSEDGLNEAQPLPSALPTPPSTSFSADADKGTVDVGRRLSTIVEAPSGDETSTLARVNEGEPIRDQIISQNGDTPTELEEQKKGIPHTPPTKVDSVPLPVPNPYTRPLRHQVAKSFIVNPAPSMGGSTVTNKILLRPCNDEDDVPSDELQTPLNPVARALLEEDVNNVFSDNENDELQTPLRMSRHLVEGQLSPLSLPVQVRLTDPLTRLAQGNVRYESGDDHDIGLEQLTLLNPPRRATQSIHAVIDASRSLPRNSLLMTSETALSSPTSEAESSILSAAPNELYTLADDWRKKAREEESKLKDLKTLYKNTVNEKRVKDAFMLKGQINESEERIKKLHEKAAKRYYKARNTSIQPYVIDVHGLRPEEAIKKAEDAFRDALKAGHRSLKVITGKGLHSKNGSSVLKPALIKQMEEQRIPCEQDPNNAGILILSLHN